MKTIIYYLVCIAVILYPTQLSASDTMNIEASLREILSNDGSPRLSGKATYISTVYKKALDVNNLLEGREFPDDQKKQLYVKIIRLEKGLDFLLKQDKTTHTLEGLYFDHDKKRRDYASLSPAMVESIRNDPCVINSLSLKTMAFDGDKTISLTSSQTPNGTTRNYATIMPHGGIYCPKFHQFGHGDSSRELQLQMFIEAIEGGLATLERSSIDGQVHATLEMVNVGFKLERILAPDKSMSTLYTALYKNNQLQQETICQDYARTSSGEWFPCEYTSNKYTHIKGEKVLTSSETFEAIPNSVEFNIPINSSIFSPKLSEGTYTIDERYRPPLEYIIEYPTLEVFIEPLLKEKVALRVPEELTENTDNKKPKSNDTDAKVADNPDKDREYKIFIPEINAAIKQSKPFIFDLTSGKLVLVFVSEGNVSKQSHNSLMRLGKGDIAWDGSLITVRNAKILTISQESHRPLKCTMGKWRDSYSLPNKPDLPYSVLVVTRESVDYLITIHKIESNGIWITYKKLNADEAMYYHSKKKLMLPVLVKI